MFQAGPPPLHSVFLHVILEQPYKKESVTKQNNFLMLPPPRVNVWWRCWCLNALKMLGCKRWWLGIFLIPWRGFQVLWTFCLSSHSLQLSCSITSRRSHSKAHSGEAGSGAGLELTTLLQAWRVLYPTKHKWFTVWKYCSAEVWKLIFQYAVLGFSLTVRPFGGGFSLWTCITVCVDTDGEWT